ncbi:hypothetical protein [Halorubrum sp. T3]|uniref:hypothetical protein n=1 Tax=Halorubrum sp. T3 TaxID=1194088 RepID=UPI000360D570|nr:hypothetical protein [Halorubrum sp. T3]
MGAEDWDDPHGLIPEQFREEFGDCETVADALRRAATRESSTPDAERRCCPECYSLSVAPKSDSSMSDSSQRLDGAWKCAECQEHFDEPLNMNPKATAFEWIDPDELRDADERGMNALLAGLDRETLVAVAIVLREPWTDSGPSYSEIAGLLPYADSWVGHRVREWKDGEHRELVSDPTAEGEPITVDEHTDAAAVATDGGRRRRWDAYGSD